MRSKFMSAALAQHFSQKRIARSVVATLVFTLIQTILVPANFLAPASAAVVTTGTCSVDGTNLTTSNILDSSTVDGTCIVRLTTGTASFTTPTGVNSIASLIVAGGGGGGFGGNGGGGGAGAVIVTTQGLPTAAGTLISGTVGDGGSTGWNATQGSWTKGGKGSDSSLSIGSSTFTASGGGGGGAYNTTADTGGSGGGKAINGTSAGSGYNYNYAEFAEYVNSGALESGVGGGGGGGAGGSPAANSSNGGVGLTLWGYKVGGGGSGWAGGDSTVAAPFGGGGPRAGTGADGCASCNGVTNTGGGGGGGGAGGSGVVVIKFVPARGQGTIATTNGYQIYRKSTLTFTRTGILPTNATTTYQWQVKPSGSSTWSNVSTGTGGTTTAYQTANLSSADDGSAYRIAVTDSISTYGISTTTYTEMVAQTLFIPPGGETDTAITTNGTKYATLANSNPLIPGTVSTMTIEAWVKPTTTCDGPTACSIISVNNSYLIQVLNGKIRYYIGSGSAWCDGGGSTTGKIPTDAFVPGDRWTHITFVRVNANVKIYINGQLRSNLDSSCSPATQAANSNAFFIGVKSANTEAFSGSIDEVRMWSTDRSANAASDMHSNETSTAGLLNYWNFNEGTGTVAYNLVPDSLASTDLTITDSTSWDASVVSVETVTSTYTTRTFYRSFITAKGGWKVPSSVSTASVLVIAGGGGGGSRVGGGGGAGGFAFIPKVSLAPNSIELIQVGQGGFGAQRPLVDEWRGQNGQSSFLGTKVRTVGGGGGAGYDTAANNVEHDGKAGGSGGGASAYTTSGGSGTPGSSTQVSTYGYGSGNSGGSGSGQGDYPAGGGGGAGGAGSSPANNSTSAAGGAGIVDPIGGTNLCFAAGGGGGIGLGASGAGGSAGSCGAGTTTTASAGTKGRVVPLDATPNSGSGGGGAGYQSGSTADVAGGAGGSGVIVIRWITALKPAYTKPVNAYLNVGMTETFTTNVAQDSATAILTRTFKWESTTPTANGAYTLIKQGTGAANAAFSWIPSDTSTSGQTYLYRLTVTDSDTAGLFITDSSTAYAVINQPLKVSGLSNIPKKINLSRSETFTVSLGTPTYRVTYTNLNSGISIDTSSATNVVFTISETLTVGTYYETLTVTDSVSASVITPLTIVVVAPPNLLNTGEISTEGLQLNYDIGNSASLIDDSGTATTGLTLNDLSGRKRNASTNVNPDALNNTTGCVAPKFTSENGGALDFSGDTKSCYYVSGYNGTNLSGSYTVEAWFKVTKTLTGWAAVLSQSYKSTNPISITIGSLDDGLMHVAFWNGGWRYEGTGFTPVIGKWTHIAGTYNASRMTTYIDGAFFDDVAWTEGLGTITNTRGLLIGNGHLGDGGFPGLVGAVRIYNRCFTAAEIAANYNATKYRFQSDNSSFITPTKKYGTVINETFTATAGFGTDTISYAVGNKSGVAWTTSGSNTFLKLQETLSAGTFYDTVTVTDSLGASTYLPITMSVSKADTLTVSVSNPSTNVFTGATPTALPRASVTGLVSTDTGTTVMTYRGSATWGSSCATGGLCNVGDPGPGGGVVFKVSPTVIDSATGISSGGLYLEVAPIGWNGDTNESAMKWSTDSSHIPGTVVTVGSGAENNRKILAAIGSAATAVSTVVNSTYNGMNDWFLPSTGEFQELYGLTNVWNAAGMVAGRNYWTSTQDTTEGTTTQANTVWSSTGTIDAVPKDGQPFYVRPIRAFSPVYTSTVIPTEVETYTVSAKLNLSSGSLSNYYNVVYETSTLKITQANQNKLVLNLYGAVAGQSFALVTTGGSGTGAVTETVTAGGNATNCQVSNRILTNTNSSTDQKFCRVTVTKAASRNYKSESLTADVYFMVFINNQPTGVVGSGSTIALNGMTSLTVENPATNTAPMITGATLSGGVLTITGYGFGSAAVTIRFYRYVPAATMPTPTLNGSIYTIQVAVPAGAQDGPVEVITATGEAVTDDIDVTP